MIILLFILGLIIGSFLGVIIYRLPRNLNITTDRSRCDNCKKIIAWFDNVPLLSYLVLKGKCRHCHKKISLKEPLIELATGIVFVIIGFNIINLILASILIAIFVIDLEHQIIPDELVFIGLLVLFFNFIFTGNPLLYSNLLAGFVSALLLLSLNLVTRGRGMGLGDVKLAILLGGIVGLDKFFVWLFFSFLIGAIIGVMLILLRQARLKGKIAFGPFLIIGLVLTIYFGNNFIQLLNL